MLYARGGFIVNLALVDNEFDAVKEHVLFLQVSSMTSAKKHVGEIEREIRTIKEITRYASGELLFRSFQLQSLYTRYVIWHCGSTHFLSDPISQEGFHQGSWLQG